MRTVSPALLLVLCVGCGGSVTQGGTPAQDGGVPDTAIDTAPPAPQTLALAEVAVFQGVKVSVAKDGAKVVGRLAPVVVGRAGILRVYAKPGVGWVRKGVTAQLTLTSSGKPPVVLSAVRDVGPLASNDGDIKSTFNFDLTPELVAIDTKYSLTLKSSSATSATEFLRYPDGDATESLDAKTSGELKVQIVPIRWGFDASNRLPDITADSVEGYRSMMMSLYPATSVTVTVHDPYDWSAAVAADGTGWEDLVQAIVKLRADDKAPNDVYYYGAFEPAASFFKYCKSGCIAGLAGGILADPLDATARAAIGLGYGDDQSWATMAHEIGHVHGRQHSPCGDVAGADKKYPYDGGAIGVWGYDIASKDLFDPSTADIMSYCWPKWISDYNYGKIFTRIATIAAYPSISVSNPLAGPQKYRFLSVGRDGKLSWGRSLTLSAAPLAEPHVVTYLRDDGKTATVTGMYYEYGDLPGGYLLVPEPPLGLVSAHVAGLPAAVDSLISSRVAKP
jgi:hypothetical protein